MSATLASSGRRSPIASAAAARGVNYRPCLIVADIKMIPLSASCPTGQAPMSSRSVAAMPSMCLTPRPLRKTSGSKIETVSR